MAELPPPTRPDGAPGPDGEPEPERDVYALRDQEAIDDDPTGRLGAYLARTQTALDILALLTLWIVVVPVADFGNRHGLRGYGLTFRLVLSFIYAVDMTIRVRLARRHWHYLRTHPLGVLAIIFPPVRVLFSLRLIRVLFRRGNLDRFLLAALFLMLNGSLIVWLFERDAAGSNIHTLGESIWWSVVTVTTVGYGDYFPVTVAGEVVATFIMLIGIITVAVITAQVSSNFVDQSAKRNIAAGVDAVTQSVESSEDREEQEPTTMASSPAAVPSAEPPPVAGGPTLEELDARLARIESLLLELVPPSAGAASGEPPAS
jgi:voltage-gated potassium channel